MIRAVELPLIVHVIHRFDYGGLENGLVNLINTMPEGFARHAIISLTEHTEIADRIQSKSVELYDLKKNPGKDLSSYFTLFKLLKKLRPTVLHTRNVGTLDCQLLAFMAGVGCRVHSEHGWDTNDPQGQSFKYRCIRRTLAPFVHRFIALSDELYTWLRNSIGIPQEKLVRICNGVDTKRIKPRSTSTSSSGSMIVGTVTRFSEIKDPFNIIRGFREFRTRFPELAQGVRVVVVGDGELREQVEREIVQSGLQGQVELVGSQLDVVPWLHKMDVFFLGSMSEGISNTILEAMAAGLPVVATRTGGNPELVDDGRSGKLIPVGSPSEAANALAEYRKDENLRVEHGAEGRRRAVKEFSLETMVRRYMDVYRSVMQRTRSR